MKDTFLTETTCGCGKPLTIRTCSWFSDKPICMDCSGKESIIKKALRAKGYSDALEGCGYIPDPTTMEARK